MISNLKTLLLLVILSFNYINSKATSDSLKIERYKKHVISLDYISRHTNNNKYYLSLTSNYCDSIIKIDNENLFAKSVRVLHCVLSLSIDIKALSSMPMALTIISRSS